MAQDRTTPLDQRLDIIETTINSERRGETQKDFRGRFIFSGYVAEDANGRFIVLVLDGNKEIEPIRGKYFSSARFALASHPQEQEGTRVYEETV